MACKCDVGLGNTGLPNCQPIASVAKKLIVVPTYADSGSKNGILLTDTLDQAYWDARVNDIDLSKRWFPLPVMENITHERAESIVETAGSGKLAFIREGVKSFSGEMWKQSPVFVSKLNEARCTSISIFIIDNDGNLIGSCPEEDGYLYPIQIDKDSWDARTVEATDSTVQKVALSFNWSDDEKDGDIRMVTSDEYAGNLLGLKGLLDIYGVDATANATTDALVITLQTVYGSKANPIKVKGLVLADFSILRNGAAIVADSVTEANGVYTFDFSTADLIASDSIYVSVVKNGYDSTVLSALEIVAA